MAHPHEDALESALDAFKAAREALGCAAANYAFEEARRISARLPTREVNWMCGMGGASLEIARRKPHPGAVYGQENAHVWGAGYPPRRMGHWPFMERLDEIESETRISDVAAGVFTFKGGEAVEEN